MATKLTKKQALPILKALGKDGYKGRKFRLVAHHSYSVNNGDLVWDGGSKTEVTFLIHKGEGRFEVVTGLEVLGNPYQTGGQTATFKIPSNVIIVEHNYFCGTDCGYTFIVATEPESAAIYGHLGHPQLPETATA